MRVMCTFLRMVHRIDEFDTFSDDGYQVRVEKLADAANVYGSDWTSSQFVASQVAAGQVRHSCLWKHTDFSGGAVFAFTCWDERRCNMMSLKHNTNCARQSYLSMTDKLLILSGMHINFVLFGRLRDYTNDPWKQVRHSVLAYPSVCWFMMQMLKFIGLYRLLYLSMKDEGAQIDIYNSVFWDQFGRTAYCQYSSFSQTQSLAACCRWNWTVCNYCDD